MPKISEFYGIKIFIFWNDQSSHKLPHFHATYAEYEAAFRLNGNLIVGKMPKTARKLIKKWALENQKIIEYAWICGVEKKPLPVIKGIK